MAFTQLQIANLALDLIHAQRITNVDATDDANALVVARNWELALEEFLCEAHWNWAKTRTTLDAASPAPDFGWENRFELPSDFISLVGVNETYSDTPSDLWEIESGYLFTDDTASDSTINLEYIKKPSDSGLAAFLALMDPKAVQALVVLLASKIAPAIAQDGLTQANALLQRYHGLELPKARTRNANMNRPAPRFPYGTSTNLAQRRSFGNP